MKKFCLTVVIFGMFVSIGDQTVFANEETRSTLSENQDVDVKGTYGTVPWNWEEDTQTLVFGGGEFPSSGAIPNDGEFPNNGDFRHKGIKDFIQSTKLLNANQIKHIQFTEIVKAHADSSFLFYNLEKLESIENIGLLDTSNVTDMSFMFASAYDSNPSLTSLDLSQWDTSNVTNMFGLFCDNNKLKSLDVSKWNTSKVTDMCSLFADCKSLTSLTLSMWDTSNVIDMEAMFMNTSNLTSLNINNWDTSNVFSMFRMFGGASSLVSLDLSKWNTSNVEDLCWVFDQCRNLRSLNISGWDTTKVRSFNFMFDGTDSLDELHLGEKLFFNRQETGLMEKVNDEYTGRWILVNSGFTNSYDSSLDFTSNYNSSYPGTYVREKTKRLKISPETYTIKIGKGKLLSPILGDKTLNVKDVTWKSSEPAVVKVFSNGKIQGLTTGTSIITATTLDGKHTATSVVTVK